MGAGVAANDVEQGVGRGLEKGGWKARRERNTEGIADTGDVFNGKDAFFAGDAKFDGATGANQTFEGGIEVETSGALGQFGAGEVAEAEEEVMDTVEGAGAVGVGEGLKLFLGFLDGVEVEEFTEISVAEELAELVLVDGRGPARGVRRGERRRRRCSWRRS